MGKYSILKNTMTRFSVEDEYQDKVNAKKEEIREKCGGTSVAFALVIVEAKLEKARLEALVKEQNLIIAAMDQILVEELEDQEYSSLKLNNGISLSIKDDVYSKVIDKLLFHSWISETGNEDLLSVNYQTMNSLVKSNLLARLPIPPGIATYFKQSISIRGLKGFNEQD